MNCKFDLDLYLKPFNNYEMMYFETALPIKGEEIQLLYPVDRIIAITNYGLDKTYKEGEDYIVKNNKLIITENSQIKQLSLDEYYLKEPAAIPINVNNKRCRYHFADKRYLMFGELDFMSSKQIAVTYTHPIMNVLYTQKEQKEKLNRFFSKLESRNNPTIVFYGDSITEGCNSSGTKYGGNVKPYALSWPEMVFEFLKKKYNTEINFVNTAKGGMTTKWGLDNYSERVNKYHPDLFVLAFGMNDGPLSKEEHIKQIKEIIHGVRKDCPDSDIVLISPCVPNIESNWYDGNQKTYYEEYEKLDIDNVAVVNMTKAHLSLLERKAYKDMSGNNINHPNDFLARVYAQAVLKVMGL